MVDPSDQVAKPSHSDPLASACYLSDNEFDKFINNVFTAKKKLLEEGRCIASFDNYSCKLSESTFLKDRNEVIYKDKSVIFKKLIKIP